MNIKLIEPKRSGKNSICCGDSFWGELLVHTVKQLMTKRAGDMPRDDVIVYCVSCIKSVHNGGKRPRYLVDLLFNEETVPGVCDPELWHRQLDEFIRDH